MGCIREINKSLINQEKELVDVCCAICEKSYSRQILSIEGWKLSKCYQCGLVYLNPRPETQRLNEIYQDKDYFKIKTRYLFENKEEQVEANIPRVALLIRNLGRVGNLLEIGCGQGHFLAAAKKLGFEVKGADISVSAVHYAKYELGVAVDRCSLEEFRPKQNYDAIVMFHALEHFPDPLSALRIIYYLLKPNGLLWIIVPNWKSIDRYWHGTKWRTLKFPDHLYYFTPKSISMLLAKVKFHIEKIEVSFFNPNAHIKSGFKLRDLKADPPPQAGLRENLTVNNSEKTLIHVEKGLLNNYRIRRLMQLLFPGDKISIFAKKEF